MTHARQRFRFDDDVVAALKSRAKLERTTPQILANQLLAQALSQEVKPVKPAANGGSGGARTRNLCRDRAAL